MLQYVFKVKYKHFLTHNNNIETDKRTFCPSGKTCTKKVKQDASLWQSKIATWQIEDLPTVQ